MTNQVSSYDPGNNKNVLKILTNTFSTKRFEYLIYSFPEYISQKTFEIFSGVKVISNQEKY